MKRTLKSLAVAGVLASMLGLVACGGGGGNTSTGGHYFTHEELAREFVRRVNVDIVGFDLELVKINTLKYDYIVVYDHDYGSYDAYYIGNYNPGENLANYLNRYESWFYYDLIPEGGNYYYDPVTGTRFQKQAVSSKNLAKMKALKEQITITKMADQVRGEFGLSAEKSMDVARFAYKLETSAPGTYNTADYDSFAKELTGSTITEFQKDFKNNDLSSLAKRIDQAAETTGMGIEGVNKLIGEMFQ